MKKRLLAGLATGLFGIGMVGFASAATVDINSRVYGIGNPIEVFLESGTYDVTPIGIADGGAFNSYTKWATVTCSNPNGCTPTVPTTVTGWLNTYFVTSPNLVSATVNGSVVDLSAHPTSYRASDGLYYPNDLLALTNAFSSTFTVNSDGLVGFYISDGLSVLRDNKGGISLDVSTVPIPGAVWLLGTGLAGLAGIRTRRRKK